MVGKKGDWLAQAFEANRKIDEQAKRMTQLEHDLKDKTETINLMKQSNKIQQLVIIAIFIAAVIGFIINYLAIKKQGEFNREAMRPWVYSVPKGGIEVDDGYIIYKYNLKCEGKSPGYHIEGYSAITFSEEYPERELKEKLNGEPETRGFIPQGAYRYFDNWHRADLTDSISNQAIIRDIIIDEINDRNVFLHIFIKYEDFANNLYFFRGTYLLTGLSGRPTFSVIGHDCNWEMVDASEKALN